MAREVSLEFGLLPPSPVSLEFNLNFGHIEGLALDGPPQDVEISEAYGWNDTAIVDSGVVLSQQWRDERQSTLVEDDALFQLSSSELSTSNEETNITSHFVGTQLDAGDPANWSSYTFRGKMKREDPAGGLGVTFHSQQPGSAGNYRVRMYVTDPTFGSRFHLTASGATWNASAVRDAGVSPQAGLWYEFRVVVQDLGVAGVRVQANVWQNDDGLQPEPAGFQIDATDTAGAYPSGTVGAWSMAAGTKRWKEFTVDEGGAVETLPMVEPVTIDVDSPVSVLDGDAGATTQMVATLNGPSGPQDVTGLVTWSSDDVTRATVNAAGLVTSLGPGSSGVVTITGTYLGLSDGADIIVTSGASSGTYQSFVVLDDITATFDQAYLVETIAGGKKIVRPEITGGVLAPNGKVRVISTNPQPTGTRHGSMVDPPTDRGYAHAYDSRVPNGWDPSLQPSFPIDLEPWQSLCMTRSLSSTEYDPDNPSWQPLIGQFGTFDDEVRLKDFSVLTCLPRIADGGPVVDTDTIRPRYVSNSTIGTAPKPMHSHATVDMDALPSLPYQGGDFFWEGGDPNPYKRYLRSCQRDWVCHVQDWIGRQLHPKNNQDGYWEAYSDGLVDAAVLALITDPGTVPNGLGGFCTNSERQALLRAVIQIAADQYYCGELIGNNFGATYPAAPPPYVGSGSFSTDSSHYTDLSYIFAYLFSLPYPAYRHRRPDRQCVYNSDVQDVIAPTSTVDVPGTTSCSGPVVTGAVGSSPSAEAQVMIGSGATMQVVDPSGLPAVIDQGETVYSWMGMVAQANRNPSKMCMWQQHAPLNPTRSMNEHTNPREWPDLCDRGSQKTGQSLESYLRSNIHVGPGGVLCGQKVLGSATWESVRNAPAYLDYIERWMFKQVPVHGQNEAYVFAVLNSIGAYGLGHEKTPGNAGSGFVTNMFLAHYEYAY